MRRHCLFGPVSDTSLPGLQRERAAGTCLVFGAGPGADLVIPPDARWPEVDERLPAGWRPDLILVDLSGEPIPGWAWSAPVPIIGLAPGVDLTRVMRRRGWRRCDRILAGPADWDERFAVIDREWTQIAARAARRRAGGDAGSAIARLEWALDEDPFDLDAARALFEALAASGEIRRRRRLAHDRRLLSQSAPELVPSESWFAEAPPPGDERASIVILCCNQIEYTRACLDSVLRWSRPPYELLLVDNGSTDGTPDYLEGIRGRPEPDRVEVIHNVTNRGFPAGCNQAIEQARGRYVVLLNNDTVVTEGWLDGLVAWANHEWPRVGLVGAVSNSAAPPQQVDACYNDRTLDGLEAFAERRRREFAGEAKRVERLTGFCLLIRREVLDRVGNFDERYGPGFFDDDDLCVRAREAGFQLLLALGVFVHHYGSRTFAAMGIDTRRQLEANFARFREKWGPERSAGYRLAPAGSGPESPASPGSSGPTLSIPDIAPQPSPDPGPRVSLCMIVRNEEANLADCLASAADLVDEVIVVDTGSTDRTREVAARLGAGVFEFPWVDDFAAARNESIRHATADWIFWLDADDRLDEANRRRLKALFAGLTLEENAAYSMKCLCPSDSAGGSATVVDHVRLFRNDPRIRWRYRVHEQILPAIRRIGGAVRWSDVTIRHVGYVDPALRRTKLDRDLRLLRAEVADHPDDPFVLFNLGSVYLELERTAEALPLLTRSLERSHPSDSIVRKLYALIVQCHRRLGQAAEALASCRSGRAVYPEDAELLFQEGLILRGLGQREAAEACLLRLLEAREDDHFASVDPGLRGHKARHNLAVLYHEQGRSAEAEAQWRAVAAEQPGFAPAWRGLAELYLAQRRWPELEAVAARLGGDPPGEPESAVLRARAALARKEFAVARRLLEEAIARAPQSLRPRVVLSHALLQEGRDPRAAERALREILALDPLNAEARHNLSVLLAQSDPPTGRQAPTIDDTIR